MAIMGSSLLDAILIVNNRYQEMSGILINESFNDPVNPPRRGVYGREIENTCKIQHLIIKM
jgi:hypothetical protein